MVLLSSDKAVSGLNLTEANHIILLDTLNNDKETSQIIEQQVVSKINCLKVLLKLYDYLEIIYQLVMQYFQNHRLFFLPH